MFIHMRGTGWIVASSIALLALSRWLSATSVEYLVLAATATAVSAAVVFGLERELRLWAVACVAAMAMALALAASTQHQLARLEHDWAAERARMSGDALAELETKVAQTSVELRDLASHALNAPRERDGAFEQLTRTVRGDDRTVVLFRDDSAFAWSGRPRVPVNSLGDALGVVGTPFYLGLYASAHGSNQRTVATHLLYAVSPADRMVRSLGGDVVQRTGIAGFRFVPVAEAATLAGARVVRAEGRDLFAVRAEPPTQGEVQLRLLERSRLLVGLMLALA